MEQTAFKQAMEGASLLLLQCCRIVFGQLCRHFMYGTRPDPQLTRCCVCRQTGIGYSRAWDMAYALGYGSTAYSVQEHC